MVSKSLALVLFSIMIHIVSGESVCIRSHFSYSKSKFSVLHQRIARLHFVSGMSFMTPEPDTPPTLTPDSYPLGDLIHAAMRRKEYLGESSAGAGTPPARALTGTCNAVTVRPGRLLIRNLPSAGTTTNPTQAAPGLGRAQSTATVISPGLLTTALGSSTASQMGARNPMSPLLEEETTTTLITTTTITTMHVPGIPQRKACVRVVCVK